MIAPGISVVGDTYNDVARKSQRQGSEVKRNLESKAVIAKVVASQPGSPASRSWLRPPGDHERLRHGAEEGAKRWIRTTMVDRINIQSDRVTEGCGRHRWIVAVLGPIAHGHSCR